MQQAFINEKKNIYFDQHLFAWEAKKHFIFASRKSYPQAIQLEAGINFTAILNKCLQLFQTDQENYLKLVNSLS